MKVTTALFGLLAIFAFTFVFLAGNRDTAPAVVKIPSPLEAVTKAPKSNQSTWAIFPHNVEPHGIGAQGPSLSYGSTLSLIAENHPELRLSSEEIRWLQSRFSALWFRRLRLEVSLATIEPVTKDETYVSIPPYPKQAAEFVAELRQTISDRLGAARAAEIADTVVEAFDAARASCAQQLVVDRFEEQRFKYKVVREIDGMTAAGYPTRATGVGYLTGNSMDTFALQPEFLPSPTSVRAGQ